VTLQIPPHKLTPNRTPGAFLSEPAILVRRRRPQQRPQQWPKQQCYQEKALSSAATTQVNFLWVIAMKTPKFASFSEFRNVDI
jgi:hypothetical protein